MTRGFNRLGASASVFAVVLLSATSLAGQGAATAGRKATNAKSANVFRTPWGDPDLQGTWTASTLTPLERPEKFADKEFLTEAEAAQLERAARAATAETPQAGSVGTYNDAWYDNPVKVIPSRRTSLIVDPPNGRIPYTPEARKAEALAREVRGRGNYDSWLGLDTGERCITDGPPVYYEQYNNNYQIVQNPGYVVILHELYRENRIIPLDGPVKGSNRSGVPSLTGNPHGHWEGDTLVVESANFRGLEGRWQAFWRAVRPSTRLVERFTRTDAHTITYRFTWEDPTVFTRPWTAEYPMSNDQASRGVTVGQIFEYACHEGNYALVNILSAARKAEHEAAQKKPQ